MCMKKLDGLLQHEEDGVGLVFWEVMVQEYTWMVGEGGDLAVGVMGEVAIREYDV